MLAGGAEQSRRPAGAGRDLDGVHFAMEFLPQQNKVNAGRSAGQIRADGERRRSIGGGDAGSDCVGTSNRHGAKSVSTQFELLPMPPEQENKQPLVGPYWPIRSCAAVEPRGGLRARIRRRHQGVHRREGQDHRAPEVGARRMGQRQDDRGAGQREDHPGRPGAAGDGLRQPGGHHPRTFGVDKDARGNAKAGTEAAGGYKTNVAKVFAAGDMRRGQSLVVWAIREGRQAARAVDEYLMGRASCRVESVTPARSAGETVVSRGFARCIPRGVGYHPRFKGSAP